MDLDANEKKIFHHDHPSYIRMEINTKKLKGKTSDRTIWEESVIYFPLKGMDTVSYSPKNLRNGIHGGILVKLLRTDFQVQIKKEGSNKPIQIRESKGSILLNANTNCC